VSATTAAAAAFRVPPLVAALLAATRRRTLGQLGPATASTHGTRHDVILVTALIRGAEAAGLAIAAALAA